MASRTTAASVASTARSSGSVTALRVLDGAAADRANFEALRILIASRRPIFIWASSNGLSVPGRAPAARQRTASEP